MKFEIATVIVIVSLCICWKWIVILFNSIKEGGQLYLIARCKETALECRITDLNYMSKLIAQALVIFLGAYVGLKVIALLGFTIIVISNLAFDILMILIWRHNYETSDDWNEEIIDSLDEDKTN